MKINSLFAALALCASTLCFGAVDEAARAMLPDDLKAKGTLTVADPPPDDPRSGTPDFSWDGTPNLAFGVDS